MSQEFEQVVGLSYGAEMGSILGKQMWELIELLLGKKDLHNNSVSQLKTKNDVRPGSNMYKTRLVVRRVSIEDKRRLL